MPRTRRVYPPEFRAQLVALHRAGRTPAELAKEFEPSEATIHTWIAQAALDERAAAAKRPAHEYPDRPNHPAQQYLAVHMGARE